MNTPKEIKGGTSASNLVILVLLAGVVGLGIWTFRLRGRLESSQSDLAAVRARSAPVSADATELRALRARVTELEGQLEAATAAAVVAPEPAATPPQRGNPMATIASQMMSNPAMRDLATAAQRRALESQYGDILNRLGFSADQRTRFFDLRVELTSRGTELGMKVLAGDLSPEERAGVQSQIQQLEAESNAAVASFFATEFPNDGSRYAEYQRLEDQRPDQTQVDALQASLVQAGNPLTDQQSTALVQILNEERKAFPFTYNQGANDASADPMAALDPEVVQTRIQEQGQLDEQIIRRASLVLGPDQVAALRNAQASRLQLIQSSADMARAMFGNGN